MCKITGSGNRFLPVEECEVDFRFTQKIISANLRCTWNWCYLLSKRTAVLETPAVARAAIKMVV